MAIIKTSTLAKERFSKGQIAFFFVLLLAFVKACFGAGFFETWLIAGSLVTGLFVLYVLTRVICTFLGLHQGFSVLVTEEQLSQLNDDDLPVYTILLPTFNEPEVISQLIDAIGRLDYPKLKLDIKLLLEENDAATRRALADMDVPGWLEMVDIPASKEIPQTKPRACNAGLQLARGEFVTIFDAEDRPETDQLKKAVIAFRALPPSVACLQAKLNCYNSHQNILTRLFTLEYTAWFDLYLPGLHAIGSPIPLGGTSNHFRTEALVRLGGWDPYNVTEDCDLGIRLSLNGLKTQILNSTTWEEAPSVLEHWFKQRTRWLKGYLQTFFVYTRNPWRLLRTAGMWKTGLFLTVVGGQVMALALLLPFWIQLILWIHFRWPLVVPDKPWTYDFLYAAIALNLFNFVFIFIFILGAYRRRKWNLALWSFCFPLYWLLTSLAAWRGIVQFFLKPHHWEKTPHGVARDDNLAAAKWAEPRRSKTSQIAALGACIIFILLTLQSTTELILDFSAHNCYYYNIHTKIDEVSCDIPVNESWIDGKSLHFELHTPSIQSSKTTLVADLTVNEGETFQIRKDIPWPKNGVAGIDLPFDAQWKSLNWDTGLGPWALREVRKLRVSLHVSDAADHKNLFWSSLGNFDVRDIQIAKRQTLLPLQVSDISAPVRVTQNSRFEAGFNISPWIRNPFDRKAIDVSVNIISPKGRPVVIPAFFSQDFRLGTYFDADHIVTKGLIAVGKPFWKVRYLPQLSGNYRWKIIVRDDLGRKFESQERVFTALAPSENPGNAASGTLMLRPGKKYFQDQNGNFVFPIGMNVGWIKDARAWPEWGLTQVHPGDDVDVFDRIFAQMAENHMNFARIWMAPWWGGLEWNDTWPGYSGLNEYNLANAWRIDHILSEAEKRGIHVDLVLDEELELDDEKGIWRYNPYNRDNGGFLNVSEDIFTDPRAKALFRKKYAYILARYSAYTSLSSWELWNEPNNITRDKSILLPWFEDFSTFFAQNDPLHRPVGLTFCWKGKSDTFPNRFWKTSGARFGGIQSYNLGAGLVSSMLTILKNFGESPTLAMITESSGHFLGAPEELMAQDIHDGLWASWVLPLPAAPLSWWWSFIAEKGVMRQYQFFSHYIEKEDLSKDDWRFVRADSSDPRIHVLARVGKQSAFFWLYADFWDTFPYFPATDTQTLKEHIKYIYSQKKPPGFSPLSLQDPGPLFQIHNLAINLSSIPDGVYDVEIWDTWGKGKISEQRFLKNKSAFTLTLPFIERDAALKMKRLTDEKILPHVPAAGSR